MAVPKSEADQLRQQISFLTNLINTARCPRPLGIRPIGAVGIRPTGPIGIRPTGIRPTGAVGIRPIGPVGIRPTGAIGIRPTGAIGIRPTGAIGIRPTGAVGNRQPHNLGGIQNQYGFRPRMPSHLPQRSIPPVLFSSTRSTSNFIRSPIGGTFPIRTDSNISRALSVQEHSQRLVYLQRNLQPDQNQCRNTLARPVVNSTVTSIQNFASSRQVAQHGAIGFNGQNTNPRSIQSQSHEMNRRQFSTSIIQNENNFRNNSVTCQSSNYTTVSLRNADVSVPTTQQETQSRMPATEQDDSRSQQMAALLTELQKTQSKIFDLQKQLTHPDSNSSHPVQTVSSSHTSIQINASLQQACALSPSVISPQMSVPHSAPETFQATSSVLGVSIRQATLLNAISAVAVQGQSLAKSNRVWVKPQPSMLGMNRMLSAIGRNNVGQPIAAVRPWNPVGTGQMHPSFLTGPNLVQRLSTPLSAESRFQLKKLQSQAIANGMTQMMAAQRFSRQKFRPVGVTNALHISAASNRNRALLIESSKYKLQQQTGTTRDVANKYRLQKVPGYSGAVNYQGGVYRRPAVLHPQSFVKHFPTRFDPSSYFRQNFYRSVLGPCYSQPSWTGFHAKAWSNHSADKHLGFNQAHFTSRMWKKKQLSRMKRDSQQAVKKLLHKRLLLLRKSQHPTTSKLKLDRRQQSSPVKCIDQPCHNRLVLINGILYKSSNKRLSKATVTTESSSTQASQPSSSSSRQTHHKTAVVVKKLNRSGMKTISVRGVKFRMDSTGKSLQRIDQSPSPGKGEAVRREVKRIDIGGVTYIQTQPGTLVRSSTIRSRAAASRAKSRSILAATLRKDNTKSVNGYCIFYTKFGRCRLSTRCPYKHDPTKVAVCTRFLRGTCKVIDCPFSHKVSPEKMPVCSFFLRGICHRDECPYLHVKVRKDADVCPDFIRGYCAKGEHCQRKHTLRCPQFAETGKCSKGKTCPMLHKKNAKRKYADRLSTSRKHSATSQLETGKELLSQTSNVSPSVDVADIVTADTNSASIPDTCNEDSALAKTDGSDVEAGTIGLQETRVDTPDEAGRQSRELPSFISLADISDITDEENVSRGGDHDNTLHIRPRLS